MNASILQQQELISPQPTRYIVLYSRISPAWECSSIHVFFEQQQNCSGYALFCAQSMPCGLHDHASYHEFFA